MKQESRQLRSGRKINAMDIHVSQRLRILRQCTGISQVELGNLVGLSFQQIQKYENGTNRICAGRLLQIAQALDVPVSLFFEDIAPEPDELEVEGLYRLPLPSAEGGLTTGQPMESVGHVASMIADFKAIRDRQVQQSISRLIRNCAARDRRETSEGDPDVEASTVPRGDRRGKAGGRLQGNVGI